MRAGHKAKERAVRDMGGSEDNALRRDSPTAGCEVLMPTAGPGQAGLAALEGRSIPSLFPAVARELLGHDAPLA